MRGGIRDVASIHAIGEDASLAKDLRDIIGLFDVAERTGAKSCVERVLVAINALGGGRNYYGRGRASAARAIVAEVYFSQIITAAAKRLRKYGLLPGLLQKRLSTTPPASPPNSA